MRAWSARRTKSDAFVVDFEDLKRELCLAERARANAGAVVRVSRVPIVIVRGPLA